MSACVDNMAVALSWTCATSYCRGQSLLVRGQPQPGGHDPALTAVTGPNNFSVRLVKAASEYNNSVVVGVGAVVVEDDDEVEDDASTFPFVLFWSTSLVLLLRHVVSCIKCDKENPTRM